MEKTLRVDPGVLKLGLVSFLTDVSSEMIFAVFAVFFTTIAGGSAALLGLLEGLADFSASSLDYAAGWLSDRAGKRKIFALAGYGFSTLAKLILLITSSVAGLGIFRVIERLGKSFRGPPRDAWLSSISTGESRGYSFGVHKALDKAGAVVGPLIAYGFLSWQRQTADSFRTLFWIAFVPAALGVAVLAVVQEPAERVTKVRESIFTAWRTLAPDFRRYVIAAGLFSLAYFSYGFLLLRATTVGVSTAGSVLLYALFNATFVIAAPLIGRWGDRLGRSRLIAASYLIYAAVSIGFAFAAARWQIVLLFAAYGVFFAIDDAQTKAFIADLEPDRRATAIGVYNFATGLMYLPASLIAGALWEFAPQSVFFLSAGIALAAWGVLTKLRPGARQ